MFVRIDLKIRSFEPTKRLCPLLLELQNSMPLFAGHAYILRYQTQTQRLAHAMRTFDLRMAVVSHSP